MAMTTIPKIKMSKNRKTHLIRKHKTSSKSHILWCQGSFSQLQCLNKVFRCWGKWLLGWCLEVGRLEMIQHVSRDVCNCKLWTFLSNWIQRFLLLVSTRYIGFCEIKAQWPTSRPPSAPPVPFKGFYSWCQQHILVSVKSKQCCGETRMTETSVEPPPAPPPPPAPVDAICSTHLQPFAHNSYIWMVTFFLGKARRNYQQRPECV